MGQLAQAIARFWLIALLVNVLMRVVASLRSDLCKHLYKQYTSHRPHSRSIPVSPCPAPANTRCTHNTG
jgi:hypothetical protein